MSMDIDSMRAPELLDNLLKPGSISPLKNFQRTKVAFKGKAILKKLSPMYDEDDDDHIDMLSSMAHHLNMDGEFLSYLDDYSTARFIFYSTTLNKRIFALIVLLRGIAARDEEASALLQKIG